MSQELEHILDICIDQLKKGKSVEECLQQYPHYAEELRPLLQLSQDLEYLPKPEISPAGLLLAGLRISRAQPQKRKQRKAPLSLDRILPGPKISLAFNFVLILLVLFWGMSALSANSLPGEFLYPIKLFTAKVKFVLTFDSRNKAELRLTFSEDRLEELSEIYRETGQVDTNVIKTMLEEARLALDKYPLTTEKASFIFSRASHLNQTQKTFLAGVQPQLQGSTRRIVDEAIRTCNRRSEWMQNMMQGMITRMPMQNMMGQRCPAMRDTNKNGN